MNNKIMNEFSDINYRLLRKFIDKAYDAGFLGISDTKEVTVEQITEELVSELANMYNSFVDKINPTMKPAYDESMVRKKSVKYKTEKYKTENPLFYKSDPLQEASQGFINKEYKPYLPPEDPYSEDGELDPQDPQESF